MSSMSVSASPTAPASASAGQEQEGSGWSQEVVEEGRKRKKLKSDVWEHYECIPQGNFTPSETSTSFDTSLNLEPHEFDENVERKLFARMIAKHDYPFLMAEHIKFREWVSYIMPSYEFRSRNALIEDLDMVYEEEKSRIYGELDEVSTRVSLTIDAWKPLHQNRSCFCLTCHYVDSEWKLHKCVIDFHVVPFPHHGIDLSKWLKDRILEWNLDKKLSCVVVDNASNNSGMLNGVKNWLKGKNALMCQGDMFHMCCAPHLLDLLMKSGLDLLHGLIDSIIKTRRHISHSLAREEKFALALKHCKFDSNRRIPLDVHSRWNSTYKMLVVAIELKDVIKRYMELESSYIHLPSDDEWNDGEKICNCLKLFDDMTKKFSECRSPTANYYFLQIQTIRKKIEGWGQSDDVTIRLLASRMQTKFDKYWEECNKLLTVAVVLDPRFKMHMVEFCFMSIYGNHWQENKDEFRKYLFDLYAEYKEMYGARDAEVTSGPRDYVFEYLNSDSASEMWKSFSDFLVETNVRTSYGCKDELEEYLEKALHPIVDGFDIFAWWKSNEPKFPMVARMARDILAIPTSFVALESSFSRARRIVTDPHASLHSENVERLMCVKDWLPENPDITLQEFEVPNEEAVAEEEINDGELLLDPNFGENDEEHEDEVLGQMRDAHENKI